jgi:competence protein ComFC
MAFLNTILELVFPSRCIACGKNGTYFCNKCLSLCPEAERESAPWINPIFDYRHPPIKKAIWFIKYKNKKKLIQIFASIMYGRITEEYSELKVMENFKEPILIPIPLSKNRYRERGFNQSELLCREILNLDKNKYLKIQKNILVKNKETEHQAKIKDRATRLKNLSNTFEIRNKELIKNKNIILIDDVTTTGATLNEAKKVLRNAGARKVFAFTIAH